MIYLDNCATTKPDKEVVEVMMKALTDDFANPSSLHSFGLKVEKEIDIARKSAADLIGANADEIYFTSGGTESNNIAVHGAILKNKRMGKKIITSKIEHASIYDQFKHYRDLGYDVCYLDVDEFGRVDIDKFKRELNDDTILVSLIYVHNELGTINNVKEIFEIVKSKNKNILCHVDGVQAVGKIPVNVKDLGCDTLSFSSHKIYGPKGMGALYKKRDLNIESLVIGGGQEKGLRSGTENVPGILGFGKACELTNRDLEKRLVHAKEIKKYLLERLDKNLDDYKINTPENSTNFIISLSILDIRAEVLLHYLEGDDIYISTASACTSNGTHKSNTLEKIGLSDKYSEGTIRICTSKDTTREDIDIFVEKLVKYVNEIRKIMR
ncbi:MULTISPECIES: cysteine desulfurase family protein [Peptoniphilus]|uniref:cysteine desulfurase family protein n=1 Tax=Peptoniphilus TaxID=162289 RepID=UPI00258AF201|nr:MULTISPECIES: cysteine desulfurase family protein [Peptoniphilus]MBS6611318.1 cysteine desulfurase [Peptoniphilus harei]MDU2116058.1 cysteine desulfurase family protein [Peptoniphilus lacydonensis]MDU5378050.1 cysteine desulfurase family protein [Peptoniphilus lacydonensis]MDU5437269.1 cysteine desulfurase family protein [Peptoniphilus lacydonensis]MDU5595588.1 cysteine desulfurase family protein [Peptoniphilus rhinitidis]